MRYLFGFALLLPMVVLAKDPPLPEALLNAKNAFVEKGHNAENFDTHCKTLKVNEGATDKELDKFCKSLEKDAKAEKQLFDKLCKELKKWGRFTLVQDHSNADVRIYLNSEKKGSKQRSPYAQGIAYKWEAITINIYDRLGVLLYTDMTEEGFNNPGILFSDLKHKMKRK
jgi:hypothetical protein